MAERVCPWYIGYLLASPVRRLVQDPDEILGPLISDGDTVLEIGPGMGFFTLSIARMIGEGGRVHCVDVQERMLRSLRRRAARSGFAPRIDVRQCAADSLQIDDLRGKIDFALAYAVVHEVPNPPRLFSEVSAALRRGGTSCWRNPEAM